MDSAIATERVADTGTTPTIEVERPTQTISLVSELRLIAEASGKSWIGLISDFAKLAFGPGKLGFDEYLGLRLYDEKLFAGVDRRAFMSTAASRRVWLDANYQIESFGLAENKIAANAVFAAHGFPIIPVLAMFCTRAGLPNAGLLRNEAELRRFLTDRGNYPLFGKPLGGVQSLGAASFEHYDAAAERLAGSRGGGSSLDAFVRDVASHYAGGYLFQRRISPHPQVHALCGERLATVRLLTLLTKDGPKLWRGCWKIPGGANVADNFWRSGNMLAQLDLSDGRVLRVVRGSGRTGDEPTHHPDTDVPMVGFIIPNWRTIVELALEGTKVLPELALIGWDIAPIDGGAVLVELNHNPDFKLVQLSDGRGIMDADLTEFLAERRRAGKAWRHEIRRKLKEKEVVLQA